MKKLLIIALMLAPVSLFAQKFAHFSATDIIPNMAQYKTAQTELQTLAKQYQDDVKRLQDELQKKMTDLDSLQATLPDNVKQRRQAEIQELYTRMQQVSQDNQEAYTNAQNEKLEAVQKLVLDALKKIGEQGGYVYIVDTSAGAISFVNASLSTDITPELKKALNIQ